MNEETPSPSLESPATLAVEEAKPLIDPKYLLKPKFVLPFPTNVSSGTNLTEAQIQGLPPGRQYLSISVPQGGTNANVVVPFNGVEDVTWPPRSYKEDKYVVISGSNTAGKEQVVACAEEAGEATMKIVYEIQHQLALDAVCGINGCTISMSMGPAAGASGTNFLNLSAIGFIKKAGIDQMTDSKHVVSSLALSMNAGWTLVSGSAALVADL